MNAVPSSYLLSHVTSHGLTVERKNVLVPHRTVDRAHARTSCIVDLPPQKLTTVPSYVIHAPLAF